MNTERPPVLPYATPGSSWEKLGRWFAGVGLLVSLVIWVPMVLAARWEDRLPALSRHGWGLVVRAALVLGPAVVSWGLCVVAKWLLAEPPDTKDWWWRKAAMAGGLVSFAWLVFGGLEAARAAFLAWP